MTPCKFNRCDGSGMLDIYILKTVRRTAAGGCFIERTPITREQSADLTSKIDWKDQTIVEAAKPCGCKAAI